MVSSCGQAEFNGKGKDPCALVSKPTAFHSLETAACQAETAIITQISFLTSFFHLTPSPLWTSVIIKRGNWGTDQSGNLSKAQGITGSQEAASTAGPWAASLSL